MLVNIGFHTLMCLVPMFFLKKYYHLFSPININIYMLSENKKFHYIGELILNRSKVLEESCQPKDDTVNWLFLNIRGWNYSFVYKFENLSNIQYVNVFITKFFYTDIVFIRI